MVKKNVDKVISDIKDKIIAKKAVVGKKETLRNLKLGKLQKIFLASNCPDELKEDVMYYAKLTKTEVVKLQYPNDEFGILCKKQFSISAAGLLKV